MPLLDSENSQEESFRKTSEMSSPKPRFDFQSAEPLKTIPQLSTNRSVRYQRPLTDTERGQAVSDLYDAERGIKKTPLTQISQNITRSLNSPEFAAATNTILGGGIVDMVRGIATGKEKPKTTGKTDLDILNYAHDNAMRGLFEPETNDVTSVALMKQYPNLHWGVAGALGTLTEFGSLMITNPIGAIGKELSSLSKESQNRLLFNKVTQSPQWGDNIMSAAHEAGVPWQQAHKEAQRHLWDAINKGNYFQVLKKNMELYKPFQLKGLTIEDVGGELGPKNPAFELKPTVKSGDKTEFGINHEEALNKLGLSKDTHIEGKDFQAGFTLPDGTFITREQAMKSPYNLTNGHSEDIPEDKRRQAISSEEFTPYELPEPLAPKKFIAARINYLENQSNHIDAQMKDLESQKKIMERKGIPTARIDAKLEKLGKQWQLYDSSIAEHMIGQTKIDDIKNEVVQSKVDSIMKYESTAEEKGLSEGIRKGVSIGKEKGRLQESQRQASLRTYAKYKEMAKQEVKKLSSQIENLNTNLLPLEYKKIVDELKSKFDLNKRTSKTLWERGQTKKFLQEATARGEQVNIPEKNLEMLEKTPLNDLTVQEVRDLHENIMRIYGQGRLKDKLKVSNEEKNLEQVVEQGKDIITRGEALSPESQIVKMLKKRDRNVLNAFGGDLNYYILNWRRPEAVINQLDSGDPQGLNTKVIWDPINQADNNEQQLRESTDKQIAEIFGFQKDKEYLKEFSVGDMKLAKSDLMTIYASSGNVENRTHILAMGFSDDIFEKVENILSEEEKLAIKKYWQMQNDRFPSINKKAYEVEGRELTQVERRFPILNLADRSPDEEMEIEYEYRKMLAAKNPTMAKNFLKERTGSELPLRDLNFFGTIYRDMDRQNHYLSYIDAVRNVNKYLKHPDIKQAIVQKHGEDTYDVLTQWLKDASVGRIPTSLGLGNLASKFTRTKLAPAYLGYNFLTTAKQLIGILPGMEMAGKSATVAFAPKFFINPKKYFEIATSKSPMMKFRAMRQEREFEELIKERDAYSRLKIKGYDKLLEASLAPTMFTDRLISTMIWNAVYEKLGTLPEKERIAESDRVVRRTQPMGGLIHLPHIFREPSEIAKQMTWLKGHTNKFFNLEQDMFANKSNGRDSNAKFASQFLFYTLLPMVSLSLIEKKKMVEGWEWLTGTAEQEFVGVWGLGELFKLMGHHFQNFTSTPAESYLRSIYAVFGSKKPSTRIKKGAELAAMSAGLPVVGAERLLAGKPFGQDPHGKHKKEGDGLNAKQENKFIESFDKAFGYKRKKKNTGITE